MDQENVSLANTPAEAKGKALSALELKKKLFTIEVRENFYV